jgi:hypothetical protein
MFETIREFALGSAHEEEVRRRHASFVLALTERLQPELSGPTQADVLGRLGAVVACREAAALFRDLGRPADAAGATLNVGTAQLSLGHRDQAAESIEAALEQYVALKYDEGISCCLDAAAALALAYGDAGDAAPLAAAAAAVRADHGVTPEPVEQRLHDETVAALADDVLEPLELGDAVEAARGVLSRQRLLGEAPQ